MPKYLAVAEKVYKNIKKIAYSLMTLLRTLTV